MRLWFQGLLVSVLLTSCSPSSGHCEGVLAGLSVTGSLQASRLVIDDHDSAPWDRAVMHLEYAGGPLIIDAMFRVPDAGETYALPGRQSGWGTFPDGGSGWVDRETVVGLDVRVKGSVIPVDGGTLSVTRSGRDFIDGELVLTSADSSVARCGFQLSGRNQDDLPEGD